MARLKFTSNHLRKPEEDMPTPRKSPRNKEDERSDDPSNLETLPATTGAGAPTGLVAAETNGGNSVSTEVVQLKVPEVNITQPAPDEASEKEEQEDDESDYEVKTKKRLRGRPPKDEKKGKNDDDDSDYEATTKKKRLEASGRPQRDVKKKNKDESDDTDKSEEDNRRKKRGKPSRKAKKGKKADDDSSEDEDGQDRRKSGRAVKPVKPFQHTQKLHTKAVSDQSEDEDKDMESEEDDESDVPLAKRKRTTTSKSKNNKRIKAESSSVRSSKRASNNKRKSYADKDEEETDDDHEVVVVEEKKGEPGKRPGPKSQTLGKRLSPKNRRRSTSSSSSSSSSDFEKTRRKTKASFRLKNNPIVDLGVRTMGQSQNVPSILHPPHKRLDEDDEFIDLKKLHLTKAIELMDHEIYNRKLEALKRERELCLSPSPYTSDLKK